MITRLIVFFYGLLVGIGIGVNWHFIVLLFLT